MASVSGEDGGRWILATLPTRGAARLEGWSGLGVQLLAQQSPSSGPLQHTARLAPRLRL